MVMFKTPGLLWAKSVIFQHFLNLYIIQSGQSIESNQCPLSRSSPIVSWSAYAGCHSNIDSQPREARMDLEIECVSRLRPGPRVTKDEW